MRFELVLRVKCVKFSHAAVALAFGKDRRGGNGGLQCVALDDGLNLATQARRLGCETSQRRVRT